MKTLRLKDVSNVVTDYPTKNIEGFTRKEIDTLLSQYGIDKEKFNKALGVCTGMIINGDVVTYHSDVELGIKCVLQNRAQSLAEFD